MSKEPLFLWLLIELGLLYLSSATSEIVVTAVLGQSVTLPCTYDSWSQDSNSMCWGKGHCPGSKCNEALLHTDGRAVISTKSPRYRLRGNIRKGDVSLTISNTIAADSTVYCCRIEVPGWFNDVKKNIRLQLWAGPPTTQPTTTPCPTTTTGTTTTTAALPTTVVTTPGLTTGTTLQTRATAAPTTGATTHPQTSLSSLPEATTVLLATQPSTEGPIFTTVSETSLLPCDSQTNAEPTSRDPVSPSSKVSEMTILTQSEVELEQVVMPHSDLLMIIAPSVGFVLLVLLVAFVLRGKVMKTNCLQKDTRLDHLGESKSDLSEMQHGREDEDGLFTL
ncbi:T-cell immunoglobulin and mucin domain-containing protein 4 [Dasypus novemcinctus]|uniref:T-cell immunoglobulin and mucin domain-containing protein 4 n=1 Tax=Dasypus novemcinctus TaxID=9361 RepID=UPI00265EACDF|nr:T-cell immunoglobulin and mucin domain-containing protein 4 [Dasypus novemcinctus]